MIQVLQKQVSFEEFITWYPENYNCRYELHDGVIVEMTPPVGSHGVNKGTISNNHILTSVVERSRSIDERLAVAFGFCSGIAEAHSSSALRFSHSITVRITTCDQDS